MSVTGFPENPPTRGGIPSGDAFGGMNAVIGILAALYYRTSTGKGQYVDISLVDSVVSSLCSYTMYYLWDGQVPDRIGNRYKFTYPYDSFKAKDNWYVLACGTDEHFRKFASLMGMPELADDQRFATRAGRNENYKVLADIINDWSAKQNSEDIISAVRGIGIPVAPILDFQQLCTNEHMRARNMFCTIHDDEAGDIVVTNNPIRMSETDPRISGAVPALGSATEKILSELGYKTDEIRQLKETGIV